jgi:predicted esterase
VASHGEHSLSLRKTANNYFPWAEWTRVVPREGKSRKIEVSVKVKAVKATKATVDVVFLDSGGQALGHQWAAYIGAKNEGDKPANHDWKKYSDTVDVPQGTAKLSFALQIYGPGSVWFDELLARYVDGAGATSALASESDSTAPAPAEETASSPLTVEINGAAGEYLLEPVADESAASQPAPLLVVLPGGNGSADFHPFVRNIQRTALAGKYIVAQPIAKKWTPDEQIVWPTRGGKADGMKFTTEELVAKVVEDVAAKHAVDRHRVFLLAWSSGGPAAYAVMLEKQSPATGALIAMSVYHSNELPSPKNAASRSIYILHSPDDRVCPIRMARQARDVLRNAGAKVEYAEYAGGHGWQGDVFGNIQRGIEWLEKSVAAK